MSDVWLITGCSSGFGYALASKALEAGDEVIATARNIDTLSELAESHPDRLTAMMLDVTNPEQVKKVVSEAAKIHGRLDVVVNNAGYGLIGALEEYDEVQIERSLDTNFFGPLRVMRAVLPIFREQKSGHFINMSAIAGFENHPGFSVYGGAKAALDSASDALREEVAPLGIKVTVVAPGPFRTDFISRSLDKTEVNLPDYARTSGKFKRILESIDGKQQGDPEKAAEIIVRMVQEGKAPSRLFLGKYAMDKARNKMRAIERDLQEWEAASLSADFAS